VELLHSGKVRDVYADGDDIILVASDRVSVYDVVLPTPIPGKGHLLTALSLWWFDRLAAITPNHVISAVDVPAEFAGRAMRCQRLDMLPVECIARGYLAGLGLGSYRETGAISGVRLPAGLTEGARLPEPVFTPTTKAPLGQHDEFMTFEDVVAQVGRQAAGQLRRITLDVYQRGHEIALARGIIIADTKLEFGYAPDGTLVLADEVLTPDSSRFWDVAAWRPGGPQHSFDKQFVRDWSSGLDWDRTAPGPEIPPNVVAATRDRYSAVYGRITGRAGDRVGLSRAIGSAYQVSGHGRAMAPSLFHALITAIVQISPASSVSENSTAARANTSSGTGPSVSRVPTSVSSSAARSRAVKNGVSRQTGSAYSRRSDSPAARASRECMSTQ
jgi:phosphoribosylaminoimidazole-succinocarboxamide synthase